MASSVAFVGVIGARRGDGFRGVTGDSTVQVRHVISAPSDD